jgi:hypothetical protein
MPASPCGPPSPAVARRLSPDSIGDDRAIQYSRALELKPGGRGILDAPHSRSMTAEGDTRPRSRGTNASELSDRTALEITEGAGKAGCPPHPWSACNKKHAAEPQVQAESSGLPCAMVLQLIRDLPGDHAWLPPSPVRRLKRLHDLSACIGAPEPHDFAVRTTAARRARNCARRCAAIASRSQRP